MHTLPLLIGIISLCFGLPDLVRKANSRQCCAEVLRPPCSNNWTIPGKMGEHSSGQRLPQLSDLPDSLLLETFFYLSAEDLAAVAHTCSRFSRITKDELLWKRVFQQRFKIPASVPKRPGMTSWRAEYQRLREETPAVLCEELKKHRDQVLHVSFSHNGEMFATCSKDGKILVWNSETPSSLRFSANMTEKFNWRYSQFSQFNKTDTLLLVSGVFHGNMTTSGEIAVFDLIDFEVQCRVTNKPYDVFGCWYNNQHLFSGSLYWTGHLQSISALWLNKASQEVESEKESVMMNLYRFSNENASSIRTVMVADVPVLDVNNVTSSEELSGRETVMEMEDESCATFSQNGDNFSDVEDENRNNNCVEVVCNYSQDGGLDRERTEDNADLEVDGEVRNSCDTLNGDVRHQVTNGPRMVATSTESRNVSFSSLSCAGHVGQGSSGKPLTKNTWWAKGDNVRMCVQESRTDLPSSPVKACYPFGYCCPEKKLRYSTAAEHELEAMDAQGQMGFPCDSDSSSSFSPNVRSLTSSPSMETPSSNVHSPPHRHRSDIPRLTPSLPRQTLRTEKLLIFTMGDETYTPHLVGFKRVQLKDIVGKEEAERRMAAGEEEGEEEDHRVLLPNVEHNLQGVNLPPTQVDHTINLKGHIVGMALSPDHRYLYVNSRQWPENYHIESVLEPPPIAQEIDIHVIDLVTFQEVGKVMRSHKAFTPNDECFFLFLDISKLYVASGAEDRRGYLWDRHYGVHLHCFPHNDVVNSVAFNPRDQEMLVTVSDDYTIKVWRSRRQMRRLQPLIPQKECQG